MKENNLLFSLKAKGSETDTARIFQTITSIFCHNISINKCLANSFTQHDTYFSTPQYFVMAEYIAKGDDHFYSLLVPVILSGG